MAINFKKLKISEVFEADGKTVESVQRKESTEGMICGKDGF